MPKTDNPLYELQLAENRNSVWIHSLVDGSTVGRFGMFGIDLHTTLTEQREGASECRLCTHGRTTPSDWALFREKAMEWWGVEVPEDAFNLALLIPDSAAPSAPLHARTNPAFEDC